MATGGERELRHGGVDSVLDAVITALNEATLADLLVFVTPERIVGTLEEDARISATTIRRYFAPRDGEDTRRAEVIAAAAVEGLIIGFPFQPEKFSFPSQRDEILALLRNAAEQRLTVPGRGLNATVLATLAAADTETTQALSAVHQALLLWLDRSRGSSVSEGSSQGLIALIVASAAVSRNRQGRPDDLAALDAITVAVAAGLLKLPSEPLDDSSWRKGRLGRPRWNEHPERHGVLLIGIYAVVSSARLDDFLSFLTPQRIRRHTDPPLDRKTITYHLSEPGGSPHRISPTRLYGLVRERVIVAGLDLLLKPIYGPSEDWSPELAALLRLQHLIQAASDAGILDESEGSEGGSVDKIAWEVAWHATQYLRAVGLPETEVLSWARQFSHLTDAASQAYQALSSSPEARASQS